MIFTDLTWILSSSHSPKRREYPLTLMPEKNCSSSFSVRSKAKFPTKAVYGGWVGIGISSRGGPSWRSAVLNVWGRRIRRLQLEFTSWIQKIIPSPKPISGMLVFSACCHHQTRSTKMTHASHLLTSIGKRIHFICPWPQCYQGRLGTTKQDWKNWLLSPKNSFNEIFFDFLGASQDASVTAGSRKVKICSPMMIVNVNTRSEVWFCLATHTNSHTLQSRGFLNVSKRENCDQMCENGRFRWVLPLFNVKVGLLSFLGPRNLQKNASASFFFF